MPVTLIGRATEKSSVGIKWTFRKIDGTDPIIKTLNWTLTDMDGTVINSRLNVLVVSPTAVDTIVLFGDDLAIQSQYNSVEMRLLTIEATYDAETGEADIPLKESVEFPVYNLKAVS